MGINDIVNNIKRNKWTWTDDFSFFFQNNAVQFPSTYYNPQDIWDMCTINIDLPQMSSNIESVVIGQEYRFWVPLHDTFTFTITFRDMEQMKLKEYFTKIWTEQQKKYYDDIKSTVKIVAGEGIMFESNDILISNISQSQLDNANTQIIEFSVEFIAKSFSNNTIKDFSGWKER
jgi:hypothetical protein